MFEKSTNQFLVNTVNLIHSKLDQLLDGAGLSVLLPVLEILIWILILLAFDFLLQKLSGFLLKLFLRNSKIKWTRQFYKHKVFRSLIHFFTISLLMAVNPLVFQQYAGIGKITEKFIGLLIISLIILFVFRLIDAIIEINDDDEEKTYSKIGFRTFAQLIKIFVVFFGLLTFIATLIDVKLSQIFTVLGALTAVVLLIFRDSILGFISGVQISTSKSIKIGDWISVSKYELEGIVKEINLTVTKVEKFDKTISTFPTYDLISTEVTNNSWMSETNTRRIKRAIVFNVNSFKFCDEKMLEKFGKIDLIQDYILQKRKDIEKANQKVKNPGNLINGKQLTNIGTFRIYAQNYLENRDDISKNDTLTVRQLAQTSIGMPLEIYCFANSSTFAVYEKIQADIFDHLITASREFGLEVSQPFIINREND
ncbi:MAG: mechanosensitive ion channel [Weeksellaceae bacterium]|nr:mechanosensitive ion channel [Weeksellaceae bacterium]